MKYKCYPVRVIIVRVCKTTDERDITTWHQNCPYRINGTSVWRLCTVEAYRCLPSLKSFTVIYLDQINLSSPFDRPDYPGTSICPIGKQGGAGSQRLTFRTNHR